MKRYGIFAIFTILAIIFPYLAEAGPFIAYSMNEAERRLITAGQASPDLTDLGGITDLAGMVYDHERKDLIIVGQVNEGKPKITLHDFVVAMRAVYVHKKTPLVSIDRTPETGRTRKQVIHWEGGIENTKLGKDMLEADILLKEIALGKVAAEVWGVRSYFSMIAERARKGAEEGHIASRFWFKNLRPSLAVREGVFAIMELDVGVETEVLYAEINGKRVQNLTGIRDQIGDIFAGRVVMNLSDLSLEYPVLAQARPILGLVSLAEGMKCLQPGSELNFWLYEYKVPRVENPENYDLIEVKDQIEGRNLMLTVSGGIELNPIVVRLKKGYPTALKEAVLNSRPAGNVLIWHPPLEGWHIPGMEDIKIDQGISSSSERRSGFSIDRVISKADQATTFATSKFYNNPLPPLKAEIPKFDIYKNLPSQKMSHDVGGVMLHGVAKISGVKQAKVDLTKGNFSLIVEGERARLAPEIFRKFVTALWSTYYSNQDPGISIDPIAPGAKKHLVRYIGKVINTDLGRVMREADYLMKKWAVGTERPDIAGFKNPDDISARRGIAYVGAMSRFWFVPEDMKFKKGGDILLFEDGRMTVKTEFMFKGDGMRADPANEDFARFFTEHYHEQISDKYPVYKELFEYAKMVSFAKYLKENGIPLYWFLMANKDLVITEDSLGTVDALAKGSDYFRDLHIEGGVHLGFEGNYIYDQEAVGAINEAISKFPTSTRSRKMLSIDRKVATIGSESFSFDLGKGSYTVVPQHSLTSGKDRRGIRYQTDLALKATGFRLTKQCLNDLKPEIFYKEFSKQLRQALPSRSHHDVKNKENYEILYKEIGENVERKVDSILQKIEGLVNQEYKTEHEFTKALENTIGKNQSVMLRSLIVKHAYYKTNLELVRYYNPKQRAGGEFGKGWHLLIPYRIKPAGSAKREFLNVIIPEKMAVENLLTGEQEILAFSTDRYTTAGYVPEKIESSQLVGLFIMSDASYRLADKLGNEFWFNQAGCLTDMIFSEYHHFRFQYLYDFTDAFEQPPYQVQPADKERITFLNALIPRRMKVKDLVHGSSEVLIFSAEGDIAGYIPTSAETSRFKILALMSNASFRLLDKKGNEIAFAPSGNFDGMAVSPEYRMVKSVCQGKHKVNFKYTTDKSGKIMIASAYLLSDEKGAKPVYSVQYQYDAEGRLCRIKGHSARIAELRHQRDGSVILAEK